MKLQFMIEMDRKLREFGLGETGKSKSVRDKSTKRKGGKGYSSDDSEDSDDVRRNSRDKRGMRRREETPPIKGGRGSKSNPKGGRKERESSYDYEYSPEVSLYDKGMQTEGMKANALARNQRNNVQQTRESLNRPIKPMSNKPDDSFAKFS